MIRVFASIFIFLHSFCSFQTIDGDITANINLIETSQNMLQAIRDGESTEDFVDVLASTTEADIISQLKTDNEKIAFWVNIYNAFIQIALKEKPELYEKRNQFFANEFISIGGRTLSFSNIEHGIIRRSQWLYGLGLIRNPFAPSYQKKYRLERTEPRIHFALNCGAKSCPPVTIYDPDRIDYQLDYMSRAFLTQYTSYDEKENVVTTSTLFSWFRGDFGGKKGIKSMLKHYDLIPDTDVKLKFGEYDWTLYLDNFVEVPL